MTRSGCNRLTASTILRSLRWAAIPHSTAVGCCCVCLWICPCQKDLCERVFDTHCCQQQAQMCIRDRGRAWCNWIDPCWTSIIPLVMGAAQGQLRTNERAVESQMGIIHSETTPFAAAQFTAEANQSAGAASANLTEEDKVGPVSYTHLHRFWNSPFGFPI